MTNLGQSGATVQAQRRAVDAGINAYRSELEDENQHHEDALRVGMLVAIDRYVELTSRGQNARSGEA